jgi:hypothetical protein
MRLLFLVLLLANVAAFGYIRYTESSAGADAQIALLQISPEKMKPLKPDALPAPRQDQAADTPAAQPLPAPVCLEWGGFGVDDAARAAAALAIFELGDKVSQRESADAGWWVYIQPLKSRAEAGKKAGELKALGVREIYVVQSNDEWRFAISLGVFKTEENANNYLAQLKQKGVRSAVVAPRGARSSTFVIRDPGAAIAAKMAGLKTDFPNAQLKATACPDAQQAAKNP